MTQTIEPFGYFKPEPFGWTDCADTDDGAQPLWDNAAMCAIEKQRDELLAALEHILAGSLSLPRFADEQAREAIASVKVGECKYCGGKGVSEISDPCICHYSSVQGGAA